MKQAPGVGPASNEHIQMATLLSAVLLYARTVPNKTIVFSGYYGPCGARIKLGEGKQMPHVCIFGNRETIANLIVL
jgi:hypothetical protein